MVRNRRYTPIQQLQFLRATYKSYRWSVRPSGFTWWFKTSPTAISDDYLLKVVYDQGKQPEVFVVHPKPLKMAEGAKNCLIHLTLSHNAYVFTWQNIMSGMILCESLRL